MIGENEIQTGKAVLKDMTNSSQVEVTLDGFEDEFVKMLNSNDNK